GVIEWAIGAEGDAWNQLETSQQMAAHAKALYHRTLDRSDVKGHGGRTGRADPSRSAQPGLWHDHRNRRIGARNMTSELSAERTRLAQLWEEHMRHEFQTCSTEATLATMVVDAYVNHVPVMTGGVGHAEVRQFYATHFIPKMPPDMDMTPLSRTIGTDQLVDEMVVRFTHTLEMDWMLPGIAPTGKRVEVALVVIVHFRDGKLAHEHIYWDQAS